MRIIEAARLLRVHPVTLRRMEKAGIIDPVRDRNGWRRFDEATIERLEVKMIGKPYAGKLQVRFDEGGQRAHREHGLVWRIAPTLHRAQTPAIADTQEVNRCGR